MENRNNSTPPSSCESEDYRCLCGSLMAKITPLGIEVKCRKCKRIQIIPNSQIAYELVAPRTKAANGVF
jgi:phage FluMu protein Com